jgi:large subunit ribosomal protein L3
MMNGLLGRKVGMTQVFAKNGELTPVTVIEIEPNVVTQVKTVEKDGYNSIQLGVEDKRDKLASKAVLGHSKKANTSAKRKVKEIRIGEDQIGNYELGQTLDISMFTAGQLVDVQGTSKGKGFQGVIKRHNQATGPMTHGSRFHRRPGSMGAVAPQVFKGKALPGQMGGKTITVQNLEVVLVDVEKNAILVKGNVPGAKKSFVLVKSAIKENNKTRVAKDLVTYNTVAETSAE